MQIVIDIPEEAYKQITEFGFLEHTHGKICYKAIKNGTPLDEILKNIDIGISASTGTDDYMVGFRNGMKWVKSLLDGKDPDYDSCISGKEQE